MSEYDKCEKCGCVPCNYCREFFNPRDKCEVILNGVNSTAGESTYAKQVCVSCFQNINSALDDFSGDKDGYLSVIERTADK